MEKIKRKYLVAGFWLLLAGFLFYTRFVNLSWGLPYPMHPDERNMANAIQQLNCKIGNWKLEIGNCYNPHFFAYGQFPLYLGYGMIRIYKGLLGRLGELISFEEAVVSLRTISAIASILNAIIIIKIIKVIINNKKSQLLNYLITSLLVIFSPFFIQFSHFGTTESLLMFFYSLIIFYSLKLVDIPKSVFDREKFRKFIFLLALVGGMAVATKISSLIFVFIPLTVIFYKSYTVLVRSHSKRYRDFFYNLGLFLALFPFFSIIFSPHNLISFNEFLSSLKYESDVALGESLVFYTWQFVGTAPVWFQLTKIFPYALGWLVFILAVLGFLGLDWKDRKINLLRLAFLIYFLPNAFLFTKWTRFMAPVLPIMTIFAILFLERIKVIRIIKVIMIIIAIIPGIAYLSVYQNPDVRFVASQWIYKNIPENSYILSETANVVDLPLPHKSYPSNRSYRYVSFNFYDLDEDPILQEKLNYHLSQADYIIVPSRRIFANHPKEKYPLLNKYYQRLFSGELGFKKIAEFNSYPKICFMFHAPCFIFADEQAEETWSVFDHPVIRIYKKSNP